MYLPIHPIHLYFYFKVDWYYWYVGNAMSKIVMDFAAAEGNTCVLVSAQVTICNWLLTSQKWKNRIRIMMILIEAKLKQEFDIL